MKWTLFRRHCSRLREVEHILDVRVFITKYTKSWFFMMEFTFVDCRAFRSTNESLHLRVYKDQNLKRIRRPPTFRASGQFSDVMNPWKFYGGFSRRGLKIVHDLHHRIPLMGSYSFYSVHVDLQQEVSLESKAVSPYLQHEVIKEQQSWLSTWPAGNSPPSCKISGLQTVSDRLRNFPKPKLEHWHPLSLVNCAKANKRSWNWTSWLN